MSNIGCDSTSLVAHHGVSRGVVSYGDPGHPEAEPRLAEVEALVRVARVKQLVGVYQGGHGAAVTGGAGVGVHNVRCTQHCLPGEGAVYIVDIVPGVVRVPGAGPAPRHGQTPTDRSCSFGQPGSCTLGQSGGCTLGQPGGCTLGQSSGCSFGQSGSSSLGHVTA